MTRTSSPGRWVRRLSTLAGIIALLILWYRLGASAIRAQGPSDDARNQRHGPAADSESMRLSPAQARQERDEFERALKLRRPSLKAAARTLRVLVLDFNPVVEGQPLTQYESWYDPNSLMALYGSDLALASGNRIGIQIVTHHVIDGYPAKPGYTFTTEEYLGCLAAPDPLPAHCSDTIDYSVVLNTVYMTGTVSACDALAAGAVDEVWLWGGPYFGYWEYVIVSPWTLCSTVSTTFTVMGFSYQRSDGEMLHDLGHRAEEVLQQKLGLTVWDRFDGQRDRYQQVASPDCPPVPDGFPPEVTINDTHAGNVHFPPNALCHYQYDRDLAVASDANDWQNYPTLTGAQTIVNRSTWEGTQRGFMLWWLGQFPRNSSFASADWWTLLFDGLQSIIYFPLVGR